MNANLLNSSLVTLDLKTEKTYDKYSVSDQCVKTYVYKIYFAKISEFPELTNEEFANFSHLAGIVSIVGLIINMLTLALAVYSTFTAQPYVSHINLYHKIHP